MQVSCFSLVIQGQAQGIWMGYITMAGSVGRIVFPLLLEVCNNETTLYIACALSAGCVPLIVAYMLVKQRRELESRSVTVCSLPSPYSTMPVAHATRELSMAAMKNREHGTADLAAGERTPLLLIAPRDTRTQADRASS
jgi:hypothetical protein